nr:hypothetical protein CFP56_02960 [Quercus suber]
MEGRGVRYYVVLGTCVAVDTYMDLAADVLFQTSRRPFVRDLHRLHSSTPQHRLPHRLAPRADSQLLPSSTHTQWLHCRPTSTSPNTPVFKRSCPNSAPPRPTRATPNVSSMTSPPSSAVRRSHKHCMSWKRAPYALPPFNRPLAQAEWS